MRILCAYSAREEQPWAVRIYRANLPPKKEPLICASMRSSCDRPAGSASTCRAYWNSTWPTRSATREPGNGSETIRTRWTHTTATWSSTGCSRTDCGDFDGAVRHPSQLQPFDQEAFSLPFE